MPTQRNSSVGFASQIPKELFKKTWGITETLGEPRKAAMYLVSTSLMLVLVLKAHTMACSLGFLTTCLIWCAGSSTSQFRVSTQVSQMGVTH